MPEASGAPSLRPTASDNRALAESLRASEARYRSVIAAMAEGVVIIGKDGRIVDCNESAEAILCRRSGEILGRRGSVVSRTAITPSGKRFPVADCPIVTALRGESCTGVIMGIQTRDGQRWISINTRPIPEADGRRVAAVVASFQDITQRKQSEDALKQSQEHLYFLATHDPLTMLPNRSLLYARIDHAMAVAKRTQGLVAVLFVDLDGFKRINDTLGHAAGDRLLKEIAERLRGCVRLSDTIARPGGDEFVVVMEQVESSTEVEHVTARMRAALAQPVIVGSHEVCVTASIGVSLYPHDADEPHALVRDADVAMYRAKQLGRNRIQFYAQELDSSSVKRLSLESSLRRAVDRREFVLEYLPKLNLRTGNISGFEGLIRWRTPEGALVPPHEFLPVAEETGLIVPIGEWALHEICRQNKIWQDTGAGFVPVSLNLSGRQFLDTDLLEQISAALSASGMASRWLELEVPESVVMSDLDRCHRVLGTLREIAVRVSVDCFGAGRSSLAYLRRCPVHTLKIDRSFIANVPGDPDAVTIVSTIVVLAQTLGLGTVGVGVENVRQLELLRELGCAEIQGYHVSKPVPASEIDSILPAPSLDWLELDSIPGITGQSTSRA